MVSKNWRPCRGPSSAPGCCMPLRVRRVEIGRRGTGRKQKSRHHRALSDCARVRAAFGHTCACVARPAEAGYGSWAPECGAQLACAPDGHPGGPPSAGASRGCRPGAWGCPLHVACAPQPVRRVACCPSGGGGRRDIQLLALPYQPSFGPLRAHRGQCRAPALLTRSKPSSTSGGASQPQPRAAPDGRQPYQRGKGGHRPDPAELPQLLTASKTRVLGRTTASAGRSLTRRRARASTTATWRAGTAVGAAWVGLPALGT